MIDALTQSWREVIDGNQEYQRLSPEEREDAERRAKWTVANLGKAGFLPCVDLAALACEQGLDIERLRDDLADARRRLEALAAGGAA